MGLAERAAAALVAERKAGRPQLAAHLFDSSNVIVSGSGIVALAGAADVAQMLTGRSAPWISAASSPRSL
jgi:hypothetical protein